MGAGISQKDLNRKLYTRLKNYQKQLARAGVSSTYSGRRLVGEIPEGIFQIYYETIRASNGECCSFPVCCIGGQYQRGLNGFDHQFNKLLESGKRPPVPVDLVSV